MRASHVHDVLSPETLDSLKILLEPFNSFPLGGPKREKFHLAIAQRDAKDDLAATHDVRRGDLFGKVQGLMQRQEDEAKVEAHVRCLCHHPAEKRKLLKILPRRTAIMHAVGDAGIAQLVSCPRLFQ